ncbi:hypothetical protein Pla175_31040 [Pirellulimonas nuda]|uniref:SH3b domain-containing protein n=1 Tax=Pirellulimonas nuda TaxID=2528009 RepID=A0A518DE01_9BACT|nr:BatD family protein [Pirellulimonas nuda]QDU89709.1 hypothetical protein Pla175_31040 [Pirellulimonas nuda]
MQTFSTNARRTLLLSALVVSGALGASAAEVRVGVSTRDTYVGMPVVVQVQVSNASDVEPPVVPRVDGVEVRAAGAPARNTQITTINGRMTKSTSLTYAYELTPQRAGAFRVPPISVVADGTRLETRPIEFVASKSETGDLLFVEVAGKENQIYVGQALDLTLKIWVRPFRDSDRGVTLSAGDMWRTISPRSGWGAFEDRMRELDSNRERPEGREVLRKDRDGVEHSYYLYEVDATIYPKSPGQIDAQDVRVIVEYPTSLGAARDPFASIFGDMPMPGGFGGAFGGDDFPSPFGRRLAVEAARPIVAEAVVEPIEVRAIPTAGRPSDYRGAVGRYHIVTEARPASVKAGDPIELLIGVAGTGPMELVQAPPLAELAGLTADFKVPSEPLAGFVQGDRKVFSTTIRPRREGVAQVPAIPFTFFDPQQGEFVTVRSEPIPIHVDPADTLALDAIVGSGAGAGASGAEGTPAALAPLLDNFAGEDLLRSEAPYQPGAGVLTLLLAAPPLAAGAFWVRRNRARVSRLMERLGVGAHRAQARIQAAQTPGEVCTVLRACLARRLRLNPELQDAAAVVGALRASGQHKLAVRCERVFYAARQADAGGVTPRASLDDVKREALAVLAQFQQRRERPQATPRRAARAASVLALAAVIAGGAASASAAPTGGTPLHTAQQSQAVLSEATRLYQNAMGLSGDDSAEAKQAFAHAAEKYQLLVDAGVENSRLYVNLANAYLQSGQPGASIANYTRALRIHPTNRVAQLNLRHATQSLGPAGAEAPTPGGGGLASAAAAAGGWLWGHAGPRGLVAAAVAGWLAFWLVIGLRLHGLRYAWKTIATAAAVVAIASAGLYASNRGGADSLTAVVTAPAAALREGDGDHFPVAGVALSEGQRVEVAKQRGGWLKVRSRSGQTGWVELRSVEVI